MPSPADLRQQLACALRATSPSYVISQGWIQLFQDFFSRGTRHEAELLLPKEYLSATTTSSSLTSDPANAGLSSGPDIPSRPVRNFNTNAEPTEERNDTQTIAPIPHQSQDGSACNYSMQIQTPISLSDAHIITPARFSIPDSVEKPSEKASRAIKEMRDAKRHDWAIYDSIWVGMGKVLDNQGVEEIALNRYGRIQALQSRNGARGDIFKYAQRFSLLLGAHELEVIERTLPPGACSRGVSLRSVAINKLAEHLHLEKRSILDENKRRSHYVSICQQFGPGALLLLGDSDGVLSLWERDLNTNDVDLVCRYATHHLVGWVDDCKKLNQKAALLLTEGLRSCGWDGHSHRDTALMKCLALHVDLDNVPLAQTKHKETQSTKRKDVEEGGSSSKRYRHNTNPDPSDHPRPLGIDSLDGGWSLSTENQFDGTQSGFANQDEGLSAGSHSLQPESPQSRYSSAGASGALISQPSTNHTEPLYNNTSNDQTSSGTTRSQQAGALEHFSNSELSQNFLLSNQIDLDDIATMHPCTFPQFILPASIDTVVPSTSPQYFLPTAMDDQLLTYSRSEIPAVDIMVSSDFPQFTLV